ncbi:MAG: hypothetical protein Q9224_006236, partial [Gallowayella concinna]
MNPSSPSPPPKASISSGLPAILPHPLTRPTSDSAISTIRSTTRRHTSRETLSRGRRARSAASSETGSLEESELNMEEYSFDLAKLGEKDSSWTIGKAGERDIEGVSSRDEGPEDFTLRMGEWMRGTMLLKKDTDMKGKYSQEEDEDNNKIKFGKTEADNIPLEATEPPEIRKVEDQCQGSYEVDGGDEILPLNPSTPAPAVLQETKKRSSAPPFSRMNTEAMQDRAAQE